MTTRSESIFTMILLGAAAVSSLTAYAQMSARPDPGLPGSPAIAIKPDSAFNDYKMFREQPVRSWKEANQEVADNPGMGSMANMPGMNMPGMGSKAAMPGMNMPGMEAKGAAAAPGKSESSMPGMGAMPGMNMPGMDSKAATAASGKTERSMSGMNMPSMETKGADAAKGKSGSVMPGMNMPGMGSKGATAASGKAERVMPGMNMADADKKHGHEGASQSSGGSMPGMAMPGMGSKSTESESAILTATGVVRGIDKPGARVTLTHDPIEAVSWPRMTIVFRVKNASLVDQVKQGDKVKFVLTKSSTGYVISDIQSVATGAANQTK